MNDIFKLNTLLFVFKSINNFINSPIVYRDRIVQGYNLRNRPQLVIPNHRSKQCERYIHIRGAKLWNELPENIKTCRTVAAFKVQFKKVCFQSYN